MIRYKMETVLHDLGVYDCEDKDGKWVKWDDISKTLESIVLSSTIGQAVREALIGLDDWTEDNEKNYRTTI
ncbi:hypothetical protein LCGC14_2196160 [marine sediment metagenome]|uniref:Uncharacterized protein n=1 Tax=marine sediment metagenome TaxID=412755 RepID=A0A0F9DI42_9ZZZZ